MSDRGVDRRRAWGRRETDIDPERFRAWVRDVKIIVVALGVALILGLGLYQHERDARIHDIQRFGRQHAADDRRQNARLKAAALLEASRAVRADCDRARAFRQLMLANGLLTSARGRAGLRHLVLHASRRGCHL